MPTHSYVALVPSPDTTLTRSEPPFASVVGKTFSRDLYRAATLIRLVGRYRHVVFSRVVRRILVPLLPLTAFAALSGALFVVPDKGHADKADAIVLIDDGEGIRLPTALALAQAGRAPNLVISHRLDRPQDCVAGWIGVTVRCFTPDPDTTRGEAEQIGAIAKANHWTSLIFVTDTPHVTRARFRLERCFDGQLTAVTSRIKTDEWLWRIGYEWGASMKALATERTC